MSLARLCKQVGLQASAALRRLSALGVQPLGGVPGLGWTELTLDGGRWHVALTPAGHQALADEKIGVRPKSVAPHDEVFANGPVDVDPC
jgi:hypothetical protein